MGLLDGDLAKAVYGAFKGRLLKGVIRQSVVASSGGLDDLGDPLASAPIETTIQGFAEDYSESFRVSAGIPMGDVKVNIFAESMPGNRPSKDDLVRLDRGARSTWYQIRRVATDPAEALWTCQSFVTEAPE